MFVVWLAHLSYLGHNELIYELSNFFHNSKKYGVMSLAGDTVKGRILDPGKIGKGTKTVGYGLELGSLLYFHEVQIHKRFMKLSFGRDTAQEPRMPINKKMCCTCTENAPNPYPEC